MQIVLTSEFLRDYKKLPLYLKKRLHKRESIFRNNPFDVRLKTHKLSGRLKCLWSFSVDYYYRVIFEFRKNNTVYFHCVGDHDIYR